MSRSRWLELLSGLAASVLGLLVLAYTLLGPLYLTASCITSSNEKTTCSQGTATFLEVNHSLQPITIFYFSFAALIFLGIALSVALHTRSGNPAWRVCLWGITGGLAGLSFFPTALAIFFLPSLLLALVAAASASGNERRAAA